MINWKDATKDNNGILTKDEFFKSEVYSCESFQEFEMAIECIYRFDKNFKQESRKGYRWPDFLWRGQSDSEWKLDTTLDRALTKPISTDEYHLKLKIIDAEVSVFANKQLSVNDLDMKYYLFAPGHSQDRNKDMRIYEFMVYLRHHGFPSPLLDWTRSPYVASFFAFNDLYKITKDDDSVAVFLYIEYGGDYSGKGRMGSDPFIHTLGPNVKAHQRHFLQQAEYSMCLQSENDNDEYNYVSHDAIFSQNNSHQDILKKFVIPLSEQDNVIKRLNLMNINAHSLFASEEGLINKLAFEQKLARGLNGKDK